MGINIPHFGLARQYQNLKEELLDATHHALKDGQLVGGKFTREFESWLAAKTKARYAITVHSGSQALEIIARYKLPGPSDASHSVFSQTIHLPNLTYPATLNAFLNAGWNVELVDTDKNGIMNSHKNGIACLVGLYGRKPWPNTLSSYSSTAEGTRIIVDGAQHWLCADGDIGIGMAISFDPTKNLPSSGNGGAIVTNSEALYRFAVNYRDNGKSNNFEVTGTNTKMSEQECAQILVRAKYIDEWQERRHLIANYWIDCFKDLPLRCLTDTIGPHAHQKFVVYLSDRNSLHTHLLTDGIESKIHYNYTLGDLESTRGLVKPDMLSTSVMLSRGVMSLPLYPELTDTEVELIADKVTLFYG
jgi:dTDP-4-amino-4,6-dideoxygalactose transaminase